MTAQHNYNIAVKLSVEIVNVEDFLRWSVCPMLKLTILDLQYNCSPNVDFLVLSFEPQIGSIDCLVLPRPGDPFSM